MAITLRDVAREAGVSASAVSRSYTDGAPVAPETREKVLAAARRLGYLPNRLASSLTTGRTRLIGLVLDDFNNPFLLRAMDCFTRGLQDRGYRPLVINLAGAEGADAAIRSLREYAVEAAIIVSTALPPQIARAFRTANVPLVHAFSRAGADAGSAQVGISDALAGRLAAKTLFDRGYRKLGFVGGPEKSMPARDRFNGFRNMATRLGLEVTAAFAPAWSFAAGRAATQALMNEVECDAIFCADDMLALGAISALRDAGRKVPEDVGVLGLNDSEMAGWEGVDLTTIAQPVAQIAEAAVEMVLALTSGATPAEPPEAVQTLPCIVVERNTLRSPA